MPPQPEWMQFGGFAVIGAALKAAFDWLRQRGLFGARRENQLWLEIGKLQNQVQDLSTKLDRLSTENHALHTQVIVLKVEINDLLEEAGKPIRYPLESFVMRGGTSVVTVPAGAVNP